MSTPVALENAATPPPPGKKVRPVDVWLAAKRATELGLEVSFPCTVVAFDSTTMKVSITRDYIRDRYTADVTAPVPSLVMEGVRVHHDGEGRVGGGYLTWPIQPGDKGRFVIQDRYTGTWGVAGTPAIPAIKHTHKAPDGFFVPGLRDDSRKIPSFDSVAAVLESTFIKLGASATEAAVLGVTMRAWADDFVTWASTHTHTYNPGPGAPVITTPPTSAPGVPDPAPITTNFLSSKVSIE